VVRRPAEVVLQRLGSSVDGWLSAEAARRLAEVGPNELARPDKSSVLKLALVRLRDPMNLMVLVVLVVSLVIGQGSIAGVVGFLVLLNVVMGANQELKSQASVDALAGLQVPQATVVRGGRVVPLVASGLVPGDVVQIEAGDVVPADGRVFTSATLEAQEAA
jgi:P-type Ca2+ transporter type 2C